MTPNPQDSAVALEVERAIREALDAGPTPGPWHSYVTGGQTPSQPPAGGRIAELPIVYQDKAVAWLPNDAAFIAACNPEAMRSLLAEIDRLRASQSDGTSGGWQSVPTTPTKEMIEAAMHVKRVRLLEVVAQIRAGMDETEARTPAIVGEWEAMLAAAPKKSQGENHVG